MSCMLIYEETLFLTLPIYLGRGGGGRGWKGGGGGGGGGVSRLVGFAKLASIAY